MCYCDPSNQFTGKSCGKEKCKPWECQEAMRELTAERDALKAQRDELLAAISECLSESNACVGGIGELSAQLGKIRAISNAAIAKCEAQNDA